MTLHAVTPDDLPTREEAIARARRGELLTVKDLAAVLGIGKSQAHKRERAGAFEDFAIHPHFGARKFSGVLVARWLDGENAFKPEPMKATLRSFGKRR